MTDSRSHFSALVARKQHYSDFGKDTAIDVPTVNSRRAAAEMEARKRLDGASGTEAAIDHQTANIRSHFSDLVAGRP
jgi:hypothetical protein